MPRISQYNPDYFHFRGVGQFATASKKDSDPAPRNPQSTPEKRQAFQVLRANQQNFFNGAVVSTPAVEGAPQPSLLHVDPTGITFGADANVRASSNPSAPAAPGSLRTGNSRRFANPGLELTIVNHPRNTGNRVDGPRGFAGENNRATVNGARNVVDLRGSPDIDNAHINVTGDGNRVQFDGDGQTNDTVVVNGDNNTVDVGAGVDNLNVNIAGSNVTLEVEGDDPVSRALDGFTINIDSGFVLVKLTSQGTVEVKGYGGNEDFIVDLNNQSKTLSVSRNAEGLKTPSELTPNAKNIALRGTPQENLDGQTGIPEPIPEPETDAAAEI